MLEHLAGRDVYIYGCGAGGIIAATYLEEVLGTAPKGMIISDGRAHPAAISTPRGSRIPVYEFGVFKNTMPHSPDAFVLNTVMTTTDSVAAAIESCGYGRDQHGALAADRYGEMFGELLPRLMQLPSDGTWCIYGPTHAGFSTRDAVTVMENFGAALPQAIVVPDGELCEDPVRLLSPKEMYVKAAELAKCADAIRGASVFIDVHSSTDGEIDALRARLSAVGYEGRYINISRLGGVMEGISKVTYFGWFKARVEELGVKIDDEVLHFRDVAFWNPAARMANGTHDLMVRNIVTWTLFDDMIPQVYDDVSLTHEGSYELGDVRCMPGDVVVDAGANYGLFTCWAAYRGCSVYSCEPDETNIAILKKQQELYPGRIDIVPKALSNKTETLTFYRNTESTTSTLFGSTGSGALETKVDAVSIDDLVRDGVLPRVDFIKADIEGAERLMLEGARGTIAKFKPKIAVCIYHRPDDLEVLTKIIKDACPAYEIEYRWKKLFAHVPR